MAWGWKKIIKMFNQCQSDNVPACLAKTKVVLWERGEVILFARGAGPITFALLTSGKPQLDGRITDFLLDATIQLWVLNPLIQ